LFEESPIEAIRDVAKTTANMAKKDLVVGTARSITEQLFGKESSGIQEAVGIQALEQTKVTGDISPGESLELAKIKKREFGQKRAEEFRQGEKRLSIYEEQEITRQVEEILAELKKIVKATKELENEFQQVVVETPPEKVGKYHLTFFNFLLKLVTVARKKINESATWLSLFASRKKERNYWAMFKKKGTSFALSGERAVATSTG